jgi:ribosomal-protein-alanine N-acetyltransferase
VAAVLRHVAQGLRPMLAEDLSEIMAIERRAYQYPWSEQIFRDCLKSGYSAWVYLRDGRIVAHGVMMEAAGECHILNLCVDPDHQRQGIGRRMLRHLLAVARRRGADTAFLEVRVSNQAAIRLYESEGFCETGRRRDYYPAGQGREDAVLFARAL